MNATEWTKTALLGKANLDLEKIKSIATLAEYVEKANREIRFLPTVLTKDFNIRKNSNAAWLPHEACE